MQLRLKCGTSARPQPGSWVLIPVGGTLRQRGMGTLSGAMKEMEYGHLTSTSMVGQEALVHVDAEHHPFVKDRLNRLPLCPAASLRDVCQSHSPFLEFSWRVGPVIAEQKIYYSNRKKTNVQYSYFRAS